MIPAFLSIVNGVKTFAIGASLFGLAAWIFLAWEFYNIAKIKGFPGIKYFVICLIFAPVGYLLVIALPDRGQSQISQ